MRKSLYSSGCFNKLSHGRTLSQYQTDKHHFLISGTEYAIERTRADSEGVRGTLAEDEMSLINVTAALKLCCLDSNSSASRDDISSVNYFWNLKWIRVSIQSCEVILLFNRSLQFIMYFAVVLPFTVCYL